MDLCIYQIDIPNDQNQVCFQPLERLPRLQQTDAIDSSIYQKVFSGSVQAKTLEDVFHIFNLDHPPENAGRSLSVSDVVEVKNRSGNIHPGFYFCDSYGFQKVTFQPEIARSPALIKGILLEPGKEARIAEVCNTPRAYQHLVGTVPEVLRPFQDNTVLFRNEDPTHEDLPFNRALRAEEVTQDLSYTEMCQKFREIERSHPDIHALGYIVFSNDSFAQPYSVESRTYAISSNNKAFQPGCGGYSIFGGNLDGTDPIIRLDAYMANEHGGKDGWKIERCYIKEPGPVIATLMGNVFICGEKNGQYISLTPAQLDTYIQRFRYPEQLISKNESLQAQPYKPKAKPVSFQNLVSDADDRRNAMPSRTSDQPPVPER